MRSIRNLAPMKLVLLVLFSVCQIPSLANAQSTNLQGKFRLQNAVHWGKAVLPPGDYSVTIDSTKDNMPLVVVRSADGEDTAFAIASTTSKVEPGGSYIYITDDGTRRVRLLNLPGAQLSLSFGPLTKREREVLRADQSQVVPVVVAQR